MTKPTKRSSRTPSAVVSEGGETHQTTTSADSTLTTNQGMPVSDNQNSLTSGARGPTLLEDFVLREKITHFDHERIPERIVHARGSAAHGYFQPLHGRVEAQQGGVPAGPEQAHQGVRPLLDRGRRRRIGRHAARRARLRGEVLHRGRQLRPGRQQHPGVLHPGRDEVPRSGARREDGAGSRLPAGGLGARHLLGFRLAHAREHEHGDVVDVGPHHPVLAAPHRRLRRPYLPADQRKRRIDLREVPLAAVGRRHVDGVGRGGEDRRRRSRPSSPRPVRDDPGRRLPGMDAVRPGVRPGDRRLARFRHPRRRPRSFPRRSFR